ncbi:MAG: 50S ribosomal protein L19e [Candidatus Aenigmatarchaeota archaeon]
MAKLTLQKKLAADVLKVGQSKVWISPDKENQKDLQAAITRADIRRAIKKGLIKARLGKIPMPARAGRSKRRKKAGSRKGSKYARLPKKKRWIATVRPLRKMLKEIKLAGEVDNATYRKLYMLIKGGQFRSRSHMRIYMEQHGMLKKKQQ